MLLPDIIPLEIELITMLKWWDSCGAFIASSYIYENRQEQTLSD